jgi:hypothetical protein
MAAFDRACSVLDATILRVPLERFRHCISHSHKQLSPNLESIVTAAPFRSTLFLISHKTSVVSGESNLGISSLLSKNVIYIL